MSMQEYIEEAESALLHTYNRYQLVLDRGDGVYLYDIEGKRYLDFCHILAFLVENLSLEGSLNYYEHSPFCGAFSGILLFFFSSGLFGSFHPGGPAVPEFPFLSSCQSRPLSQTPLRPAGRPLCFPSSGLSLASRAN